MRTRLNFFLRPCTYRRIRGAAASCNVSTARRDEGINLSLFFVEFFVCFLDPFQKRAIYASPWQTRCACYRPVVHVRFITYYGGDVCCAPAGAVAPENVKRVRAYNFTVVVSTLV